MCTQRPMRRLANAPRPAPCGSFEFCPPRRRSLTCHPFLPHPTLPRRPRPLRPPSAPLASTRHGSANGVCVTGWLVIEKKGGCLRARRRAWPRGGGARPEEAPLHRPRPPSCHPPPGPNSRHPGTSTCQGPAWRGWQCLGPTRKNGKRSGSQPGGRWGPERPPSPLLPPSLSRPFPSLYGSINAACIL